MTDRINALTLVLNRDIRDDDIEFLRQACMALKFVTAVKLNVANIDQFVAETRVQTKIEEKIYALLKDIRT